MGLLFSKRSIRFFREFAREIEADDDPEGVRSPFREIVPPKTGLTFLVKDVFNLN